MIVSRTGEVDSVSIEIQHKGTTVGYTLGLNYSGSGALKLRGPVVADVNYEFIADKIMRLGEFKDKHRPVLVEELKKLLPETLSLNL